MSGGTIAFVAGNYTDRLAAIRALDYAFLTNLVRLRIRAAFAGLTEFDHWRTGTNPLARRLGLRTRERG